jgi:hypothetical protein
VDPEPPAFDRELEADALYSAELPLEVGQKRSIDRPMWIRPSCTGRHHRLVAVTAPQTESVKAGRRRLFAAHPDDGT